MGAAFDRELIRRRLFPDVCTYCVSRNESVSLARRGLCVACRDLPITFFLSKFRDLLTLKKLITELALSHYIRYSLGHFTDILLMPRILKTHHNKSFADKDH